MECTTDWGLTFKLSGLFLIGVLAGFLVGCSINKPQPTDAQAGYYARGCN